MTNTTLAAAFGANEDTFKATSATGATVGGFVKIDNEYAIVAAINGVYITVKRRGCFGSKAIDHNILALVTFGLFSEIGSKAERVSNIPVNEQRDIVTYGADGAIAVPKRDTVAVITKASAAALTLADPDAASDGVILTIVPRVAAAHTVTLATGFAGSNASDVFTFDSIIGSSLTLMALAGKWTMIATSYEADESTATTVA